MKFKPTQNNQKQHNRNVIDVLSYALAHADRGTLFTSSTSFPELVVGGEQPGAVLQDTPGKFSLPQQSRSSVRTRITKVQSPGKGAYAFEIKTGRDLEITVFCNQMKDLDSDSVYYFCEANWKQGTEVLGSIQYRIAPSLVTLE